MGSDRSCAETVDVEVTTRDLAEREGLQPIDDLATDHGEGGDIAESDADLVCLETVEPATHTADASTGAHAGMTLTASRMRPPGRSPPSRAGCTWTNVFGHGLLCP